MAGVIRLSCGSSLVNHSIAVGTAPPPQQRHGCNACYSTFFYVDRRGRALLYYIG